MFSALLSGLSLPTLSDFSLLCTFASRIWSHRLYFCVNYCILFLIQLSVAFAPELSKKSCGSFLGKILWCIDRKAFPFVPVIIHHHRWSLWWIFMIFPSLFLLLFVPHVLFLYVPVAVLFISTVRWIATAKRIHLVIGISVLNKGGIGGLWDKVQHGQETKQFSEFFSKILIVNIVIVD